MKTNLKRKLIYVVDDDPLFLDMVQEAFIDDKTLDIRLFQTGEECLTVLYKLPAVIFLDYYLDSQNENAKDGMKILKEIIDKNPKTKVVILSGQENGKLVFEFAKAKAYDYIIKDEDTFKNMKQIIKEND